jgi:hypothetical protein
MSFSLVACPPSLVSVPSMRMLDGAHESPDPSGVLRVVCHVCRVLAVSRTAHARDVIDECGRRTQGRRCRSDGSFFVILEHLVHTAFEEWPNHYSDLLLSFSRFSFCVVCVCVCRVTHLLVMSSREISPFSYIVKRLTAFRLSLLLISSYLKNINIYNV